MPIYQYKCVKCGEIVEVVRSIANREMPVTCHKCDGACEPMVSRPGRFQRGAGWNARMDGASMPGQVD